MLWWLNHHIPTRIIREIFSASFEQIVYVRKPQQDILIQMAPCTNTIPVQQETSLSHLGLGRQNKLRIGSNQLLSILIKNDLGCVSTVHKQDGGSRQP